MLLTIIVLIVLAILKLGGVAISWWLVIALPLVIFAGWFALSYLVVIFSDNKIEEEPWESWDDHQTEIQQRLEKIWSTMKQKPKPPKPPKNYSQLR